MARCKHCKGKSKCDNCSKADKLNKQLLKVLTYVAKKKAKKRVKKMKGKTLAEYSKDKMLMDLHTKSLMGSGGGVAPGMRTGNLDSEMIKKDIHELKQKQSDHSSFIDRAKTGMEQHIMLLENKKQEAIAPRHDFNVPRLQHEPLSISDIMSIQDLPEMIAKDSELRALREENARLEAELLSAELTDDDAQIAIIAEQQVANKARVSKVSKEKQQMYEGTRQRKKQALRDADEMQRIKQREEERQRIAEEQQQQKDEKQRQKAQADAEKAEARNERSRKAEEKKKREEAVKVNEEAPSLEENKARLEAEGEAEFMKAVEEHEQTHGKEMLPKKKGRGKGVKFSE